MDGIMDKVTGMLGGAGGAGGDSAGGAPGGDLVSKVQAMLAGGGGATKSGGAGDGEDMMGKLKGMATKFLADRKGSNDPAVAGDGTVAADIAALKAAMKGFGSDDEKIVNIIFRRPREHLQKLIAADGMLMTRLKMETSGVLQEMIEAAFETHAESRAQWLAKGMHSAGTDEECVVDCLGTATPSEIQHAREAYAKTGLTTRVLSLDFRIKFETGGLLQDVFEAVLSETRPESGVEDAHLAADVEAFHAATAGKFGTDEKAVISIVANRSRDHIRAIGEAYQAKYGDTIFEVIKSETSGNTELALMACMVPTEFWVAYRIHAAISGVGTDEETLIRNIMIPTQEEIKAAALVMEGYYNENLVTRVSSELSGSLRDCVGTYLSHCIAEQ